MRQKHPIIVIGRSFGSGGRAIGRCLSEILDIPFYDKELLNEAAKELGFHHETFARADEKRPTRLKRLLTQMYGVQEAFNMSVSFNAEALYEAQSKVIKSIAERGPCVIVGRTADYILREHPGLFSIYLHAPLSYRSKKIVERGDAQTEEEAKELATQKDRNRREYYNYFTGRKWGHASNYALSLDSSVLSPRENAEFIASYLKKLQNF